MSFGPTLIYPSRGGPVLMSRYGFHTLRRRERFLLWLGLTTLTAIESNAFSIGGEN